MEKKVIIRPQEGFQQKFLSSKADIVIGGGGAGGGKTYALLLDPLRSSQDPNFGAVIFRRTTPQIKNEGGLWDTSEELFPLLGAEPRYTSLQWLFPGGMKISFMHLEYEKDKMNHQGAQYPWIGFDELTHFTKGQFFYLMTRNRSPHGIPTSIRATCNPDPDSWVADLIKWWIDPETGFPIPERDGVLRYFTVDSGHLVWGDSPDEVVKLCPHIFDNPAFADIDPRTLIKSLTFIRGSIYGNQKLIAKDPSYLASLLAQDDDIKSKLLDGNWKLVQDDLAICDYEKVNDLFSNKVDQYKKNEDGTFVKVNGKKVKKKQKMYITCDVARFGRDLATIYVWEGFKVVKIVIFTKCSTDQLREAIEEERSGFNVPKSQTLVDEGGIGGGVVDGGYKGFNGNSSVVQTAAQKRQKFKEDYKNLKAQCWYKMAAKINAGEVAIDPVEIIVDGVKTESVKIGNDMISVIDLIKKDLRCYKRAKVDKDVKRCINDKENQKNILGGRSPDNGDTIMMRMFFDLKPSQKFIFKQL